MQTAVPRSWPTVSPAISGGVKYSTCCDSHLEHAQDIESSLHRACNIIGGIFVGNWLEVLPQAANRSVKGGSYGDLIAIPNLGNSAERVCSGPNTVRPRGFSNNCGVEGCGMSLQSRTAALLNEARGHLLAGPVPRTPRMRAFCALPMRSFSVPLCSSFGGFLIFLRCRDGVSCASSFGGGFPGAFSYRTMFRPPHLDSKTI